MNKFENPPQLLDKRPVIERLRNKAERTIKLLLTVGILSFSGSELATLISYGKPPEKKGKGVEYVIKDSRNEKKYKVGSNPEDYIHYIEQSNREQLTDSEKETIRNQLNFLLKEFSSKIIASLVAGDVFRKEQRGDGGLKIYGFEKIGVSSEKLKELWAEPYYPASAIENVSEIKFEEGNQRLKHYGIENEAAAGTGKAEFADQIIFYPIGKSGHQNGAEMDALKQNLDWRFSHELGHLNDWIENNNLPPSERVFFLHEVTQAFHKTGSFRDVFGYVESIKNPVKEEENFYKVREWWATLCEYYFTFPDILLEESPEDFELVEKWIRINPSKYNPMETRTQRDSLLNVITANNE